MDIEAIEPAVQSVEPSRVEIKSTLASKVNLADFQNAVPVIRELSLANDTDNEYKSLKLTVASEPPFLKPKTWHIVCVSASRVDMPSIRYRGFSSIDRTRRASVLRSLSRRSTPFWSST